MTEWRDRDLLEGLGNNLILSAGLIFQRLECVQATKYALKEAKFTLERLANEKDQMATSLESERNKIITLSQEKDSILGEKQLALKEK